MSYYYKYKFVSPDPLFARVKEELKSYFDAGMVDDLLFPVWTEKCLRKLGRSSWKINTTLLFIDTFEARLPPDFMAVREAWLTATTFSPAYRKPGAFYQQITTVLNKPYDVCNPAVNCDPCNPDILTVVAKTNTEVIMPIQLKHLLVPGNISVRKDCTTPQSPINCEGFDCLNFSASGLDSFDIRDNKMVTNFREGDIYLTYYSSQSDENGYQLIPDNFRVQEFIEAFIKQKLFEQLFNMPTDETFQQTQYKFQLYKQMADEAFIMADIEIKKKTIYERAYGIRKDQHRNDKYRRGIYNNEWRWDRGGRSASSWGLNE